MTTAQEAQELARLEDMLDSFDFRERKAALAALAGQVERGAIRLPGGGSEVNLHCHTFFSYNPYGYSPSKFAWLARKMGLAVAGIVDFDVLDGLNEFQAAGRSLELKTCVGLETRVYVPEFSDKEMNSPGEPGISYHMGVGFTRAVLGSKQQQFLLALRQMSEERNRDLMRRVNTYLAPVMLDYDQDVLPLTPSGNATERHICLAYALKAHATISDPQQLMDFWSKKLGADASGIGSPTGMEMQSLIRAKTMKQGGVGYVRPGEGSFPWLPVINEFILAAGAIPTLCWLDGTSDGEASIEELLEVAMSTGVAAINVIPDRNYTPGRADTKLANLYQVMEIAKGRGLLVVAGTEMNSPGQRLVDDFGSAELAPLVPPLLRSAYAVYAHSVLQRERGLGYMSEWARRYFRDLTERGDFYSEVGRRLQIGQESSLASLPDDVRPELILRRLS